MIFFIARLCILIGDSLMGRMRQVVRWRIAYKIVWEPRHDQKNPGKIENWYRVLVQEGDLFISWNTLNRYPDNELPAWFDTREYAIEAANKYMKTGLHPCVSIMMTSKELDVKDILES